MTGLVAACGSSTGSNDDGGGGQDPEDGAAVLQQERPDVDRAGDALGQALSDALGGTAEVAATQYDVCSSAPVEGLSYSARWALPNPDSPPTLDQAAQAASDAGWEIGETSEAEGFIPEKVYLSLDGAEARLSVDDGEIVWSVATDCIRVTEDVSAEIVGPA